MNLSVDDLKKRWKNIKDQYRKELKKLPQSRPGVPMENITSNWKYFEYMTFMKDEMVIYKETQDREEGGRQEENDIVGEVSSGKSFSDSSQSTRSAARSCHLSLLLP